MSFKELRDFHISRIPALSVSSPRLLAVVFAPSSKCFLQDRILIIFFQLMSLNMANIKVFSTVYGNKLVSFHKENSTLFEKFFR